MQIIISIVMIILDHGINPLNKTGLKAVNSAVFLTKSELLKFSAK